MIGLVGGPTIEDMLTWMLANKDRNPSAEVVIEDGGEVQRFRVTRWRNGTIAFRPIA